MPAHKLRYSVLEGRFAVCQLPATAPLPEWALRGSMFSITRTTTELSIVCSEVRSEEHAPAGVRAESGWACLRLQGPFPFEMTGVLTAFLNPLAAAGIAIFAVSTFDTDYVLLKNDRLSAALAALEQAGHERLHERLDERLHERLDERSGEPSPA